MAQISLVTKQNAIDIIAKQDAKNESIYAKKDDLATAYVFKGTVDNFASLPVADNKNGDVYNITAAGGTAADGKVIEAGDNVAWNGTGWDALGGTTDLSAYQLAADLVPLTSAEIDAMFPTISGGGE